MPGNLRGDPQGIQTAVIAEGYYADRRNNNERVGRECD
jgi:hypothetical protein